MKQKQQQQLPAGKLAVCILVVSNDDIQKLGQMIGEMPTKFGAPLLNSFNEQIAQINGDPAAFVKMIEGLLAPIKATLAKKPAKVVDPLVS
jgi:hypothetical protein